MKKIIAINIMMFSYLIIFAQDWRLTKISEWGWEEKLDKHLIKNNLLFEYNINSVKVSTINNDGLAVEHSYKTSSELGNILYLSTFDDDKYVLIFKNIIFIHDIYSGNVLYSIDISQNPINRIYYFNSETKLLKYRSFDDYIYTIQVKTKIKEKIDFGKFNVLREFGNYYLKIDGNTCSYFNKITHETNLLIKDTSNFIFFDIIRDKYESKMFIRGVTKSWTINEKLDIDTIHCILPYGGKFYLDNDYIYFLKKDSMYGPTNFVCLEINNCNKIYDSEVAVYPQNPYLFINDNNLDSFIFVQFLPQTTYSRPYYKTFNITTNKFIEDNSMALEGVVVDGYYKAIQCGNYLLGNRFTQGPAGAKYYNVTLKNIDSTTIHTDLFNQHVSYNYFSDCVSNKIYVITENFTTWIRNLWLFEFDLIYNINETLSKGNILNFNIVNNFLKFKSKFESVEILNSSGNKVGGFNSINENDFQFIDLPNGLYILKAINQSKQILIEKFIVVN